MAVSAVPLPHPAVRLLSPSIPNSTALTHILYVCFHIDQGYLQLLKHVLNELVGKKTHNFINLLLIY